MKKSLAVTALFLLPACGRTLEAGGTDTDGSTGSSSGDPSTSITTTLTSTTASTTDATSDSTTLSTTDATTDATSGVDSSGTTTGGGGSGCCEVHDAPNCDEEETALCVCKASPECCVFGWDQSCVDLATGACAATCMGGGSTDSGSTGGAVACDSTMEIELGATDAVLDGSWAIQMSQQGEGMIAAIPMGEMGSGTVTWSIDVPCDDDWHIWVRAVDFGSNDSFFARLDGGPDPAPIFELDCGNFGQGYVWRELDQRDPENGGPCEYVEDPWVASWATGTHEFQLEFRESIAVARIVVTNDDTFVPM